MKLNYLLKKANYLYLIGFICLALACATPTTLSPRVNQPEIQAEAHKQRKLVVESEVEDSKRLMNISYKILSGACPLWSQKRFYSGFIALKTDMYKEEYGYPLDWCSFYSLLLDLFPRIPSLIP